MSYDNKIAIVIKNDLESWQKLNVASFLASSVAIKFPDTHGKPFVNASNSVYLPFIKHPFRNFSPSWFFAAIGSAVENSTEAQQFMFPVTIPIIISFMLGQYIIQQPDSPVAFWASMFPLTSPIDMMVRLPFGVPNWQIALSFGLLVLGFMGTTWMAGKIYRVGILMYGKKPTWREISKWVFYKG